MFSSSMNSKFLLLVAFCAGLAIPVSTSLQNITVALICVIALTNKEMRNNINFALKNYFIIFSIAFYLLMVIWVFKSRAPHSEISHMLGKMRIFLLAPLIYVYFMRQNTRISAMYGFLTGGVITFVVSIFMCIIHKPLTRSAILGGSAGNFGDWAAFRYHTYHDYFLALMVIGLLSIILYYKFRLSAKMLKWTWLTIIVASIDILYLVQGRAGQILFILMTMSILVLWNTKKGLLYSLLIMVALPFVIYTSPAIQGGINRVESDMSQYDTGNSETSIGYRIEFQKYSKKLIAAKPILGYGTGSFHTEYGRITGFTGIRVAHHPHNDFYLFWVENGILGPLALLLITFSAAYYGWRAKMPEGKLAIVLAFSYSIGALQGSFYTDNISSSAYMVMMCVLLTGKTLLQNKPATA